MVDAIRDVLSTVFGGWENFTQGAAGAIVGVLGAYGIAVMTSRREIARERERTREAAGQAAAGDLIRALFELAKHVKLVRHIGESSDPFLGVRQLHLWEDRRDEFAREVHLHGSLLTKELESRLTTLTNQLGDVVHAECDEDGPTSPIEPGRTADLDALLVDADNLIADCRNSAGIRPLRLDPMISARMVPSGESRRRQDLLRK